MPSLLQWVLSFPLTHMPWPPPRIPQCCQCNHLLVRQLAQGFAPIHSQPVQSLNWWDPVSTVHPNSLSLYWPINTHCPKCGMRLLNTERNTSSCGFDGLFPTQQLFPCPPNIDALLAKGRASDISQTLHNVVGFSTPGVYCGFRNLGSPSKVVLCGRSYHCMLYIQQGQYQLRWFLYA